MRPSPDSRTRGPTPFRKTSSQIGTYITFSVTSCWMRRRVASRRLASVSRPPAPAAARRCRGSRRRSRPAGGHELIEASGRVAESAARALDDVPVLLLRVAAEERHSLEGPELRPDADRLQRVDHRLREV